MDITIFALLQDAFFAALASIGFGSISNMPRRLFAATALVAAAGHALRYALLHAPCRLHIVPATFFAATLIGILSQVLARRKQCTGETIAFPALLPMIPGMYAYGTLQALISWLGSNNPVAAEHYFPLFCYDVVMTLLIIVMMVIGIGVGRQIGSFINS